MAIITEISNLLMAVFKAVMNLLWGDLITIPLPGGSSIGLSLLVILLIPAGIFFTIRTKFPLIRFFAVKDGKRRFGISMDISEKNNLSHY